MIAERSIGPELQLFLWLWALEALNQWLQLAWQSRILAGGATRLFWIGIATTNVSVLAVAAVAMHAAFFLKRPSDEKAFVRVFRLLPHLLLCGLLFATSILMASPGIVDNLSEFKLGFLGRLLFYVAGAWSLVAVFESLSIRSAACGTK